MAYGSNTPWGLKPVRYKSGSPYMGAVNEYPIASAYATNIFTGDPVISLSDGTIGIGVAGSNARGVFMGVKYRKTDGLWYHEKYWPASQVTLGSQVALALIADDPDLVFDIQETNGSGAAGTALNLADVNLNANFYVGAGSTTTGLSGVTINNASEATTSTLNLKILRLSQDPRNLALGVTASAGVSFANWEVCWNTHELNSVGTAGL